MTTEDDFQAALDAHPEDWQTRLVFADWLDERGDPRAEGYRVMGHNRLCPMRIGVGYAWWKSRAKPLENLTQAILVSEWFARLAGFNAGNRKREWKRWNLRREAEDAAALAFAKLPADRRAELLALQVPA